MMKDWINMRPCSEIALLNTNGRYSVMQSDFEARLYWAELKLDAVTPQKITRCAERLMGGEVGRRERREES